MIEIKYKQKKSKNIFKIYFIVKTSFLFHENNRNHQSGAHNLQKYTANGENIV